MSFRKRSIGLSRTPASSSAEDPSAPRPAPAQSPPISGVRPSPLDGRPTTSTGTPTLDSLLGGHAGLALGNSLLVEESGTTDFAGALLRYYAAEGAVQGHQVHVVGVGEQWGRELPGLVGAADAGEEEGKSGRKERSERMKIAWRYERLGEFGSRSSGSRASPAAADRASSAPSTPTGARASISIPTSFCHTFDLAARLTLPTPLPLHFIPIPSGAISPFPTILNYLRTTLSDSPPQIIHRLILPSLLSPLLYPPSASAPHALLPFLHALRSLLRQYPGQLTCMLTLPLDLYPRTSGVVRWVEGLCDGVLALHPFPHLMDASRDATNTSGGKGERGTNEEPQGLLHVHALPVVSERAGGAVGEDMAFSVSRRKFVIRPFSLPPVLGDEEAQMGLGNGEGGKELGKKEGIEF
ncbi:paxneb superfamily protein-like protein [Cryomyces antarcticus]|nr:hypothetical protein LTR04_003838 [Oleoguttula sp. CCFEE 6159]